MERWLPNPYAIAQLLTNTEDITPILRSGGKAADDFLRETFLKGKKQKTMTGAIAVFERIAALFDSPVPLPQAIEQSKRIWAAEGYGVEAIKRVLPELAPAFISAPAFTTASTNGFRDANTLVDDDNRVSYLDPVQGDVGDCYLISAMIALAWAKTRTLTVRLNGANFDPPAKPSFEWQFHDDNGADANRLEVSGRIMMFKNRPRYARSSTPAEDWPSLVEKAYVAQVCRVREPSKANYKSIDAKKDDTLPQHACQILSGGEEQAEILDSDGGRNLFLQDGRLETRSGVMTKPVMAWTKKEEDFEETDPDVWNETGLWPRHAYAVLGVMVSNNTLRHVVLRNPHGAPTNPNRDGYHDGPWTPEGRPAVPLNKDGVFAISRKLFFDNFEDIGWVDH